MKKFKEIFEELKKPFAPEDIEWRIGRKSKDKTKASVLAYMTARAVQERFDEAVGPENWTVTYTPIDMGSIEKETYEGVRQVPAKGFICQISITGLNDENNPYAVYREDGSQCTDFEPIKGGLSGAFKRAATQFGVGRYLYNLKETWVPIDKYGNFTPPKLPSWALPEGYSQEDDTQYKPVQESQANHGSEDFDDWADVPFSTPIEDAGNDDPIVTFGKYNGKKISEINDEGYLTWLAANAKDSAIRNAAIGRVS